MTNCSVFVCRTPEYGEFSNKSGEKLPTNDHIEWQLTKNDLQTGRGLKINPDNAILNEISAAKWHIIIKSMFGSQLDHSPPLLTQVLISKMCMKHICITTLYIKVIR